MQVWGLDLSTLSHAGRNPLETGKQESPQYLWASPLHVLRQQYTKEQLAGIGFQALHLHDLLPPAVNARRGHVDGEDQPQVDDVGGGSDALAPHVGQQALQ